jgi:hypothetical protein
MNTVRASIEVMPGGRFKTQAKIRVISLRLTLCLFAPLREKFCFSQRRKASRKAQRMDA